jgi:hypothetical protein
MTEVDIDDAVKVVGDGLGDRVKLGGTVFAVRMLYTAVTV